MYNSHHANNHVAVLHSDWLRCIGMVCMQCNYSMLMASKCLQAIAEVCAVCNDAHIEFKEGKHHAVGAPTEAALAVLAEKVGVTDPGVTAQVQQRRASQAEGRADYVCQAYCRRYMP